jgi:uncharacterized protein YdcH (DUF465 family)
MEEIEKLDAEIAVLESTDPELHQEAIHKLKQIRFDLWLQQSQ